MARARQIANIMDGTPQHEPDVTVSEEDDLPPVSAQRVDIRQSPYLSVFCGFHPVDVIIDTGATGNMIREDTAKRLRAVITKTGRW